MSELQDTELKYCLDKAELAVMDYNINDAKNYLQMLRVVLSRDKTNRKKEALCQVT